MCVCACVPVCLCTRVRVCVCVHTCACVCGHTYACVQARLCVCLAAPQMLQWCAWRCAGVAFAETGVRKCWCCCSLSVERAVASMVPGWPGPHDVCTLLQHTVSGKHLHRALHAPRAVQANFARHEHLNKLKLFSPLKYHWILLAWSTVNFSAGTKPRAPDAASAAREVC